MPGSSETEGRRWQLGAPWAAMAEHARATRGREREAAESEPARATSSGDSTLEQSREGGGRARVGATGRCCPAWWPRAPARGISSNRWRATVRPVWDAFLGRFQAESANGPKMKFDLLLMLSNFD
jgi:hypothetical protein